MCQHETMKPDRCKARNFKVAHRNFPLLQAQVPSSTEPFLSTSRSHHVELTSLFTCSLKFVSPEATVLVTLGIYRLLSVIKAKAHWVHSPRGSLGWSDGLSPACSSWASNASVTNGDPSNAFYAPAVPKSQPPRSIRNSNLSFMSYHTSAALLRGVSWFSEGLSISTEARETSYGLLLIDLFFILAGRRGKTKAFSGRFSQKTFISRF